MPYSSLGAGLMMNNRKRDIDVFVQPAFFVALLVLLVNDFYLKIHYPSWITGKLSDFAGLYVFVQSVAAFTGIRVLSSAIISAFLFVFWKAPAATPLIEFVNYYSIVPIHRTVDYTDLVALCILPFAVRMYADRVAIRWNFLKYPIAALAMFAIMGTSTIPPSYNLKFELKSLPQAKVTSADKVYENIDQFLKNQGMRCESCERGNSYRRYVDVGANITAYFNYDEQSQTLFIALDTFSPDKSRSRTDELQSGIVKLLYPQFENVTVTRSQYPSLSKFSQKPAQVLIIEFPNVGLPLTCSGNGINNPEVAKALGIIDELSNLVGSVNLRQDYCYTSEVKRCRSDAECRHAGIGRVTGPALRNRAIHLETRMYVGWGGTTLQIELTGDDAGAVEATGLMSNLEEQLRRSLHKDIRIAAIKPDSLSK